MSDPKASSASPEEDEALIRARRRLLKAGLYTAPFIATFGVFAPQALAAKTPCGPPPCPPPCSPKKN
jgi:hypothetical protein